MVKSLYKIQNRTKEFQSMLQSKEKRRLWLNARFLENARSHVDNPNYIIAEEFNLRIPPDVLEVATTEISQRLLPVVKGDEIIYGIPSSGSKFIGVVAQQLGLMMSVSRKGKNIPRAWRDVLTFDTHSYTIQDGKPVRINFGFVEKGSEILLFDDIIATGKTIIDSILAFLEKGIKIKAVGAMFAKGFEEGINKVKKMGVKVIPAVTVDGFSQDGGFILSE